MMNDFMEQTGPLPEAFAMQQQHELHHYTPQMHARSQSPWAQEFHPGVEDQARMEAAFQAPKGAAFSAADFARFQQMNQGVARAASPMAGVGYGA
jgi:peroxin-5